MPTNSMVTEDAQPTIADFASFPWARLWDKQEQTLDGKPHLARWLDAMAARPAVAKGLAVAADRRGSGQMNAKERETLFGRR